MKQIKKKGKIHDTWTLPHKELTRFWRRIYSCLLTTILLCWTTMRIGSNIGSIITVIAIRLASTVSTFLATFLPFFPYFAISKSSDREILLFSLPLQRILKLTEENITKLNKISSPFYKIFKSLKTCPYFGYSSPYCVCKYDFKSSFQPPKVCKASSSGLCNFCKRSSTFWVDFLSLKSAKLILNSSSILSDTFS